MKVITACVLLLALPLFSAELIQVIQLARHGARTPNSFEFIPDQYPETEGQLTVLGLVQEYFLGQEMRKRYVEDLNFLSDTFNSSEVLIKSSWKNRTMRSAYAFANGLYPQEDGVWHENIYAEGFNVDNLLPLKNKQRAVDPEEIKRIRIDEDWAQETVEVISMDGDLHFHAVKNGNCPPAEQVVEELKKSREFQEMEKYFRVALYSQLAQSVNRPLGYNLLDAESLNIKKAKSVLDNYRCNTFHNKEHPQIDERTLKILRKSRHFWAYKLTLVDDMVRSVSASKLFSEFLEYTSRMKKGVPNTPKYIFYSAHDTNLEVLFSVFLLESVIDMEDHYNVIPFSSVFSLEVHKEESKGDNETKDNHYVKILFNDEPQFIKWCLDYKCTLDQFHKILEHYMMPNLEDFCSGAARVVSNVNACSGDMVCI